MIWRTTVLGASMILAAVSGAQAGIVSPRGGGAYPDAYLDVVAREKGAFALRHAWIDRRARQRAGDVRFSAFAEAAFSSSIVSPAAALSGSFRVPVVLGYYADVTLPAITNVALDRELFTGPWTPGTMTQYWSEVSFGLLDVSGTVYDWVPLAESEAYYTGGVPYYGIYPGVSRTGEMIGEILDARDAAVDFGDFDNDGPDGVPNSGDDDGYVDVLLVVHPTIGAECGYTPHMWSHSWVYSAWPESGYEPYRTNDARAGGGSILVDDYIIVPSLSCAGAMIEIGVICHEVGHAIGLPDLYDSNGGGNGIGFWGLMGSGNWNTPSSPAHPDAWCREQLGWLNPVEIDWRARSVSLRPIETYAEAAKLPLPMRRFGPYRYGVDGRALVCSYTASEAAARGWPDGEGYGNGWHESMIREFSVDATRPVTLEYDLSIDVEADYDFGMLILEADGTADTIARYTGQLARRESIDLGPRLGAGARSFTLRFLFISDDSYSDEDGYYDSRGGYTFNIDNVSISGGGLDYRADFEIDAGGWRFDGAPAEYFIVENRRALGFDANVRGQGMVVWHAESSTAWTRLGNTGGSTNMQARGLVLEEADGNYNLLNGSNSGDSGDPFPGSSDNRSFGPSTDPRSYSNGGRVTPVLISGIAIGSSGAVTATFVGGMFAPTVASVAPDTVDKLRDTEAVLDIRGESILYGASCALARGADTIAASAVEWLGETRVLATFALSELYAGSWDVVVKSGDGQTGSLAAGVAVVSVYLDATVVEGKSDLLVSWTLLPIEGVRGCLLYRSDDGGAFTLITPDTLLGSGGEFSYRDGLVELGVDYSYRIVTYLSGGIEEPYVLEGPYRIGLDPAIVNYPNPFSGETRIRFVVPADGAVEIDVYDASGARVERLAAREFIRGTYELPWRPRERDLGAGVYFCVFRSGGTSRTVKLVYVP